MSDHPLKDAIDRGTTWCEENGVPVPKYTVVVKITGNSREEISNRVRMLDTNWDYQWSERDEIDSTDGTTTVLMRHTNPAQTPEEYAEALHQWSADRRVARQGAEHRISQTPPWPPTPESTYMLTRFVCSAGDWDSGSIRDVRSNDLLEVARRDGERHAAELAPTSIHKEPENDR